MKKTIADIFQTNDREDVDQRVARFFYCNDIPFNVARSPFWTDMVTGINNVPKGYKNPNYEKIRTSLLDKEQSKVQRALTPIMQDWSTHGLSIASDGWSNLKNQQLINTMTVSGGRAVFVNGHDVSGIEKTGLNIAEFIFKAIDFVGPSNVVQVITDNASNCKAAGAIIQGKHPHIFWSGCLAHTLNLLMKDIGKSSDPSLSFFNESYNKGKAVVKYIKNHGSCQFLYKTFSDLELLKTKKTRFGHVFIVMQRLVTVQSSLVAMVLSNHWETLRRSSSDPNQHDTIKKTVMEEDFWSKTKRVLKITKPIYKMLRFCDTDQAIIGEVYEQMYTMLWKLKDILVTDPVVYNLVHQIVVERWDRMNIPLHCLAYVLVPKYYTHSWLSKPAPGGVRRMKPHCDLEVQKGYLDAIEKMIIDLSEATKIRHQMSDFVSDKGVFAQPQAIKDRATMQTLSWWHMYGGPAPELYSLALRVLSQGVNTFCAERCWSTYSYIHSVKRNRLICDRAEKLVFVHYNHRLLSRYRADYESFKNWDVFDGDANIEEPMPTMGEGENMILSDSDDDAIQVVITPTSTAPGSSSTSIAATSSTLPPSALTEKTHAQMRLEKARGKRQKK
ncbi:uncharacterized protein LOC131306645 [Rhododendron vialii]|uniref:uncharacterized protein LOC131306645 n=1 Tax=Rhododendron vialii TaxID=182163 RepID=UPI0026600EF7|nr:uncharacterized protein LOC131306645 [Rhododendron vialii]